MAKKLFFRISSRCSLRIEVYKNKNMFVYVQSNPYKIETISTEKLNVRSLSVCS